MENGYGSGSRKTVTKIKIIWTRKSLTLYVSIIFESFVIIDNKEHDFQHMFMVTVNIFEQI